MARCPYSVLLPNVAFLLCKCKMKANTNYKIAHNAYSAYCPHQKYCTCADGLTNDADAAKCYQKVKTQNINVQFVAEEQ